LSKSDPKQFLPRVEKNIPLPAARKERGAESQRRINWPFTTMSHGDSFLLPVGCSKQKAYAAFSALKRRGDIDTDAGLVTQLEGEQFRVWLTRPTEK
jgi:hypothetical protein